MTWTTHRRDLFNEQSIPEITKQALDDYVFKHYPPGGFLEAVLTNDLRGAVSNADEENLNTLPAIVAYVYNKLPVTCRGTPERFQQWLDHSE